MSTKYTTIFDAGSLAQTLPFENPYFQLDFVFEGSDSGWSWPSSGNTISADLKTLKTTIEFISPSPDADAANKLKTMEEGAKNTFCGTYTKISGTQKVSALTNIQANVIGS